MMTFPHNFSLALVRWFLIAFSLLPWISENFLIIRTFHCSLSKVAFRRILELQKRHYLSADQS